MRQLFQKLGFDQERRFTYTRVPELGIDVHAREWSAGYSGKAIPRAGAASPIVLVAGLGVSSRYWVPLARRLAARRDVLAPDLPGFGRTPPLPGSAWQSGPDPREQADELRAWMDARHIDRVILCGHSVGCQTAVDFAIRYPQRVERLVLAGPTYEAGKRTIPQQLARLVAGGLFEIPWLHVVLPLEYGTAGPLRIMRQALRSMSDPIEKKLPLVEAPTLVLRGEYDTVVSNGWARTVAELLPRGRFIEIGKTGHAIQFSASDVTAEVINDFLDGDLDPARVEESIVAPLVDQRRLGPLAAPPQPISARAHGLIGAAFAGATLAIITSRRCGPRTRRTLLAAAAFNAATTIFTDFEFGLVRRLPMVTHTSLDFTAGSQLATLAVTRLRKEPAFGRRAAAWIGLCQMATALLTHAPTGPATLIPLTRRSPQTMQSEATRAASSPS